MMGGMGLLHLMECDGCGARTGAEFVGNVPDDWHVFTVTRLRDSPGRLPYTTTVCPECWGTKTLAEVLGA